MTIMNEASRVVVHAWLNRMRCELVIVWLCLICLPQSLFPVLLSTLPMSCITSTFCSVRRSCFVFSFLVSLLHCVSCPVFLPTFRHFFLLLVLQRELSVSAVDVQSFLNPSVWFVHSGSYNRTDTDESLFRDFWHSSSFFAESWIR